MTECFLIVSERGAAEYHDLLELGAWDVKPAGLLRISREQYGHACLLEDRRYEILGRALGSLGYVELFLDEDDEEPPYLRDQFLRFGLRVALTPVTTLRARNGTRPLRTRLDAFTALAERALTRYEHQYIKFGYIVSMADSALGFSPVTQQMYDRFRHVLNVDGMLERGLVRAKALNRDYEVVGTIRENKVEFAVDEGALEGLFGSGRDEIPKTYVLQNDALTEEEGLVESEEESERQPGSATGGQMKELSKKQKDRERKRAYQKRRKAERVEARAMTPSAVVRQALLDFLNYTGDTDDETDDDDDDEFQ